MRVSNLQRGDTMIEMAITFMILGVVLLTVFMAANKSLVISISATERTSVRDKINSQLEMVEYLRDWESGHKPVAEGAWAKLLRFAKNNDFDNRWNAVEFYNDSCRTRTSSFWLEYNNYADKLDDVVKIRDAGDPGGQAQLAWLAQANKPVSSNADFSNDTSVTIPIPGFGVWLDAGYSSRVCSDPDKEPYIDIVARACWTPLGARGGDIGRARFKTVKRLSVVKGREILCGR